MPTPPRHPKTPGVYVTELNPFTPPPIVGVETAHPAFVGYTEQATLGGAPVPDEAITVRSLAEFEAIFGGSHKRLFAVAEVDGPPGDAPYDVTLAPTADTGARYVRVSPADATRFVLYESVRLFYDNGGGTCTVVSVGGYDAPVALADLQRGLAALAEQVGPSMLVVPDATQLGSEAEFATLVSGKGGLLPQCAALEDRVAILDVWGAERIDPTDASLRAHIDSVVSAFRDAVGGDALGYGMAYVPALNATVVQPGDIDYTHIADASRPTLQALLADQAEALYGGTARYSEVKAHIDALADDATNDQARATNQALVVALPALADIERAIAQKRNVLPASGALAGVYVRNDETKGVWNAPANTTLASVASPTLPITDGLQADLNVPVDGKAVNAIRAFPSRGPVVWGARTLDGNSNDWRYIQVRRTIIYVEQSIKNALASLVFAPNDGNTWVTVTSMISNFLQGLWSQGGLMGATADEAFTVACGLGSTMTSQDVLNSYMVVQVTLQMVRPAEFIELTIRQRMEGVS